MKPHPQLSHDLRAEPVEEWNGSVPTFEATRPGESGRAAQIITVCSPECLEDDDRAVNILLMSQNAVQSSLPNLNVV